MLALLPLSVTLIRDLVHREPGVDIVALLALLGALVVHEYLVGAIIATMYAGGQALEGYASNRAQRELHALLARAPRVAHRYEGETLATVPLDEVRVGDRLLVRTGEVVPTDGLVEGRAAVLDESALTGEAHPVERAPGERVRSGVVNAGPPFELRVTVPAAESTYAGIVRLVEAAQASKAPFVRLADRYALVFVPLALSLAGLAWGVSGHFERALAVLVVATPCPLILAVPVAIVSGISSAARRGIIVKGGGALELLGRAQVLLLDKTGTLTQGRPTVTEIVAPDHDAAEVLRLAASLDQASQHPLADAIVRAAQGRGLALSFPTEIVETLGRGIRGQVEGRTIAVGRADWVAPEVPLPAWVWRARRTASYEGLATVFVAIDGQIAGVILLDDPVRVDSSSTLRQLRRAGIRRIVMVTGDRAETAAAVARVVGVDEVLAERSPAEKVAAVEAEREYGVTVMVGDGINDAPALAAADIGVAMGARGATASSEAADVVLVVDRLDRLAEALAIARRSRRIALESVLVGMGLAFVAMGLAAAGNIPPVAGAVLQEAIDVAVILNALRALRGPLKRRRTYDARQMAVVARLHQEHIELRSLLDQLRAVADRLDSHDPEAALADVQVVYQLLVTRLLPHEREEEQTLLPLLAEQENHEDPTGSLKRMHMEIEHLTRMLGRLLDESTAEGTESVDLVEARRILYGLYALLRFHIAEEEENIGALLDGREAMPASNVATNG